MFRAVACSVGVAGASVVLAGKESGAPFVRPAVVPGREGNINTVTTPHARTTGMATAHSQVSRNAVMETAIAMPTRPPQGLWRVVPIYDFTRIFNFVFIILYLRSFHGEYSTSVLPASIVRFSVYAQM